MRLEYVGHACFYIVTDSGVRIIIDPYDNSLGLTPVDRQADIALVSHHHHDHDYLDGVHGEYAVIDGPGEYEEKGVRIRGFELPHDKAGGSQRGKVTAYLIEADGASVLHLSDVGTIPDESFFEALPKNVDVVMVPVGGRYTVDAQDAFAICEKIDPSAVIPMHYKTNRLTLDIAPVNGFIDQARRAFDIQRQLNVLDVPGGVRKKHGRVFVMENSF